MEPKGDHLDAKACDMMSFDLYWWFYGGKIDGDVDPANQPTYIHLVGWLNQPTRWI